MILLILFAFLAGVITILSPCILPVLPIILFPAVQGRKTGKSRPFGIVIGFVISFTFFTLFLSSIVRLINIPADSLRLFAVIVIAGFGISFLIPKFQLLLEKIFSVLAQFAPRSQTNTGFIGGIIIGISLGLLWTPCVGPILASVISLALIGTITFDAFLITLAYSIGTAIPMFIIIYGGQKIFQTPWLIKNTANIQKIFGVLMILTAIAIFTNLDRKFQSFVLDIFPKYGANLTWFEDIKPIRQELKKLKGNFSLFKRGSPEIQSNLLEPKAVFAPEIITGGQWFNSKPLTIKKLKGKVIVIDFWTYSCINCQRTLPYLRRWYKTYKDKGLVIIGVHSPEFEFEKNPNNLKKAIKDFMLEYPIVQDNNFDTWRAYNNQYWPAKYFIDKDGYIRHTHFGEGEYDQSEQVIQELLKEAGASNVPSNLSNPSYNIYSQTPETYLGYKRLQNFASLQNVAYDNLASYTKPENLSNDNVAFEGKWFVAEVFANPQKGSRLYLNFEAKEVYLVMRPKNNNSKIKVSLDKAMNYFGEDAKEGIVTVDGDRLYKLINLSIPNRHTLILEFLDDRVELYAFTFG